MCLQEIEAAPEVEVSAPPTKAKGVFGGLFSRTHADPPADPVASFTGAQQLRLIEHTMISLTGTLVVCSSRSWIFFSTCDDSTFEGIPRTPATAQYLQCPERADIPLLSYNRCSAARADLTFKPLNSCHSRRICSVR